MHAPLIAPTKERFADFVKLVEASGEETHARLLWQLLKSAEVAEEALRRVEMLEQRVVTLELEHSNLLHRLSEAIPERSPWEDKETVVLTEAPDPEDDPEFAEWLAQREREARDEMDRAPF